MAFSHWRIIQIGWLARNPYWGEQAPVRPAACTTALVETQDHIIVVDPGFETPQQAKSALDRHCGLGLDQVNMVLLTHLHPAHYRGLEPFANAEWLAPRAELRRLQNEGSELLSKLDPYEDHSLPGIEMMPAPGHTHGSAAFLFDTRDGVVAIAGDAILSYEHFEHRDPGDRADDSSEARRSIDQIAQVADIIIPGHDNYFIV